MCHNSLIHKTPCYLTEYSLEIVMYQYFDVSHIPGVRRWIGGRPAELKSARRAARTAGQEAANGDGREFAPHPQDAQLLPAPSPGDPQPVGRLP